MKTKNPLLVTTDLTFKFLIAVFAVVSMVIMKNYHKYETPNLYAKSQFEVPHAIVPRFTEDADGTLLITQGSIDSSQMIEDIIVNATYCGNSEYVNWYNSVYDGKYSQLLYSTDAVKCAASAQCTSVIGCATGGLTVGEMIKLSSNGLWVKTFLQESTFSRQCV